MTTPNPDGYSLEYCGAPHAYLHTWSSCHRTSHAPRRAVDIAVGFPDCLKDMTDMEDMDTEDFAVVKL